MKLDWSFPRHVLVALIVIVSVAAYPVATFGDREIVKASIIGAVMTTINVLLGYAAIEYSFDKSTTTFFKYVLGGMGIRTAIMAVVLVMLIKGFAINAAALISSMGVLYVAFLTLEIFYIQKKISARQNVDAS